MALHRQTSDRGVLAVDAARALAVGRHRAAMEYADRLCRTAGFDDPSHLTLFALAATRSGFADAATDRLVRALACDPTFLPAARAGMNLLSGRVQERAARTVFRYDDSDPQVLAAAALLCAPPASAAAELGTIGGMLRLRVGTAGELRSAHLAFEPEAAAPGPGMLQQRRLVGPDSRVEEWLFPRPIGPARAVLVAQTETGTVLRRSFAAALDAGHGFDPHRTGEANQASKGVLNVIIPIYEDFEATAACLQSLRQQDCRACAPHVILVNDNSPSERIGALVRAQAGRPGYTIVENAENLGFTGAVNKGLSLCLDGDVLLLNADTVLPRRALDRLVETARANPATGTLTPLSNNGQYVSFPEPFAVNAMPEGAMLERLAEAAWDANATAVCAVPSGIGFCLFVRRDCMLACHRLGEQYEKGYYEDVDLCLRAENSGWSNVCATGVYVAHHGSRSFGDNKALLAARNRTVLDRAYPMFGKRAAAWLADDPLFPFRGRLEDRMPAPAGPATLLLFADAMSRLRAEQVAEERAAEGERMLLAHLDERGGKAALLVKGMHGAPPQSTALPLADDELNECTEFLRRYAVNRVVVLDPAAVEAPLLDALAQVARVELAEGDAGLFCPRRSLLHADGRHCGVPDDPRICDACIKTGGSASAFAVSAGTAVWRRRWASITFGQEDVPREAYLRRFREMGAGEPEGSPLGAERDAPSALPAGTACRLALLPLFRSAAETVLLQGLCRHIAAGRGVDTVVVGETLGDDALLAFPNVFVTGPVRADALREVVQIYGITHVLIASRRFAPGHPLASAAQSLGRPLARYAFPFEVRPFASPTRLLLDVRDDVDTVALTVADWIEAVKIRMPQPASALATN